MRISLTGILKTGVKRIKYVFMNNIRKKSELDSKLQILKNTFGDTQYNGNIYELKKLFKDNFNTDIVKIGDELIFDFSTIFNMTTNYRKKFNNDPIQPITVTYLRADIIFYTYDKHPEFGENYIMWDADWTKYLYPVKITQSILWKNKEYLKEKNPNEYYLQVNLFDINSKFTKYIKDIVW